MTTDTLLLILTGLCAFLAAAVVWLVLEMRLLKIQTSENLRRDEQDEMIEAILTGVRSERQEVQQAVLNVERGVSQTLAGLTGYLTEQQNRSAAEVRTLNETARQSLAETREVMKTNPKLLSLEEMFLLAQTYEPGSSEFNQVMETAVRLFPADPTANINAAFARMASGDIDAAAECLDKAGNTPRAIHARGVMALLKGDSNLALRLFREALAAGDADAQRNIDILEL